MYCCIAQCICGAAALGSAASWRRSKTPYELCDCCDCSDIQRPRLVSSFVVSTPLSCLLLQASAQLSWSAWKRLWRPTWQARPRRGAAGCCFMPSPGRTFHRPALLVHMIPVSPAPDSGKLAVAMCHQNHSWLSVTQMGVHSAAGLQQAAASSNGRRSDFGSAAASTLVAQQEHEQQQALQQSGRQPGQHAGQQAPATGNAADRPQQVYIADHLQLR